MKILDTYTFLVYNTRKVLFFCLTLLSFLFDERMKNKNNHKGEVFMQIQVSTDYALRILQYLSNNTEDLPTATTISQAVGLTYPFFVKIASQLKKEGLLHVVQGRNGGYKLSRNAAEISIYDVFLAIEGPLEINRCLKESSVCARNDDGNCKFHVFFARIQADLVKEMTDKCIADFAV